MCAMDEIRGQKRACGRAAVAWTTQRVVHRVHRLGLLREVELSEEGGGHEDAGAVHVSDNELSDAQQRTTLHLVRSARHRALTELGRWSTWYET